MDASDVNEVIMGNVISGGQGMNIARQCSIWAGIPVGVPSFTVNKVCGSGLKSVALGAQSIMLGENKIVLAGGPNRCQHRCSPFHMPVGASKWAIARPSI